MKKLIFSLYTFPCDGPTFTLYTFLLFTFPLFAQKDSTTYFAEVGAVAATGKSTPFWLRANQFGTVPLKNPFGFVKVGGQTTWGTNPRKPQLHLQTEMVANVGATSQLLLPVASATFRYRHFEAYVGRRKEFFGLGDTLLTSGSYAWSGNALPLPKVQVGTRGFVPLGFTKGLLAFQATFSHGWFGKQDSVQGSYLHQKMVFVRLGQPQWKAKFYLGMIHNVQWGGKSNYVPLYSIDGKFPSSFKDFLYLTVAKTPKGSQYTDIDTLNQLGNHLGSIDLGIDFIGKKWDVFLYHQHPYEDKSGLVFVNFPDGLYGLRFKNKNHSPVSSFRLYQLTMEYLTTMDKGANIREDLKLRYEADNYFSHGQYIDGWAYKQRILGTPFINRYMDIRAELTDKALQNKYRFMINNNSIKVIYFSLSGEFESGIKIESKLNYSQNFEIYSNPFINEVNQFSGLVRASFPLSWLKGTELQTAISLDQGGLYFNSFGGMLSLRKSW